MREDYKRAGELARRLQREVAEEERRGVRTAGPNITDEDWRRAGELAARLQREVAAESVKSVAKIKSAPQAEKPGTELKAKPPEKRPGILTRVGGKLNIDTRERKAETARVFKAKLQVRETRREANMAAKVGASERHQDAAERARAFQTGREVAVEQKREAQERADHDARAAAEAVEQEKIVREQKLQEEIAAVRGKMAAAELGGEWDRAIEEAEVRRKEELRQALADAGAIPLRRSISGFGGKMPPMFGTQSSPEPPGPAPGTRASYAANSERMRDAAERARAENARFERLLEEDKKRRGQEGDTESSLDRLGKRLIESFTRWRKKEPVTQSPAHQTEVTPPAPREKPDEGFTWQPSGEEKRGMFSRRTQESGGVQNWIAENKGWDDRDQRVRDLQLARKRRLTGPRLLEEAKRLHELSSAWNKKLTPTMRLGISLALVGGAGIILAAGGLALKSPTTIPAQGMFPGGSHGGLAAAWWKIGVATAASLAAKYLHKKDLKKQHVDPESLRYEWSPALLALATWGAVLTVGLYTEAGFEKIGKFLK